MKNIQLTIVIIVAVFSMISCGGGNSDNSSSSSDVPAPSSLLGKSYRVTISSGSGVFATTGNLTINASSTENTYTIAGDGVNVANSAGSFTYSTSGSQGILDVVDSSFSFGSFVLTFTTSTTGTYQATVESDPNSNQTGSFVEL